MELNIEISIPDLWDQESFKKTEWGSINFLVGPNATGKTRFSKQLEQKLRQQYSLGRRVHYFSSQRLIGHGRQYNIEETGHYKDSGESRGSSEYAFLILKKKPNVLARIEATMAHFFGRRIRLVEETRVIKPSVQRIDRGDEYALHESECHGLKELITLLTFIYDDDYNCLILDEPELHLHPQSQTFLLQEIRKVAGDPLTTSDKKCFFIVTHSPYFVDIRTLEDLKHCIVFQPNRLPAFIDKLEGENERRIRRLLPRLNTHHKQFFFASRPIFVEGHTDQQIFTLIQEKRDKLLGASGSCIIDVGGIEELDPFFRICKELNLDAQFIADLDVLIKRGLRKSVSEDSRFLHYMQSEGIGTDINKVIDDVREEIDKCLEELNAQLNTISPQDSLTQDFLTTFSAESDLEKKRYIFILGLKHIYASIIKLIPNNMPRLPFILGRLQRVIQAFKCSGVHVLPKGELENYLHAYKGNPFKIPDEAKSKAFEQERDSILENNWTEGELRERYGELIDILDEATNLNKVDAYPYIIKHVRDWIYKVQSAFNMGDVRDEDSLKRNATIEWPFYSQILDLLEFSIKENGFTCRFKLKPSIDPQGTQQEFDEKVSAADYQPKRNPTFPAYST